MDSFIIDNEFQILTLEVSAAEYEKLEEDIFDKGCTNPLHVWDGILLDGRKRYAICKKWDIAFSVETHEFKNRNEAIVWICSNNMNRLNNNDEMNTFLIGKHYEAAKAIYLSQCNPMTVVPKYHYRIAGELGQIYNIASGTVYKYGVYARGLTEIISMNLEFGRKILSGKIKVSHDNIAELSKYTPDRLKRLYDFVVENKIDHVCYSELRHEAAWRTVPVVPNPTSHRPTPKQKENLKIKQMPVYDPDSEISSLTLTIPSWISSIKRTQSLADLTKVSAKAKASLNSQLHRLSDTINTMLLSTEEES